MGVGANSSRNRCMIAAAVAAVIMLLGFWKPHVLIEGVQRACLYAVIALPMALILGIVGIINLAHGEYMMLGAYFAYFLNVYFGIDPLAAIVPALAAFFIVGVVSYRIIIKHVLGAPELNQLLLTFGLAMVLEHTANLLWTSRPVKLPLQYVSSSATIGSVTFGTYEFIYVASAVVVLVCLQWFLKKTATGQAALAVGQNPRGAKLVGIHVDRTYLIIFSLSIALVGSIGAIFMTRHSIFPLVGAPFTMKSFCLIAMAGIGNLMGIVWCSLILGLAENFLLSFRGYAGWADILFFALIVGVIMVRSRQRQVK
ncbi:MAG TPA: branched-chain amino acid ABC transporter permease [Thermodesulfobacteriota bacterium]|nr:branched-chain amino acid ABC transporter permease [Thermodesulfobacteriota bacterium]